MTKSSTPLGQIGWLAGLCVVLFVVMAPLTSLRWENWGIQISGVGLVCCLLPGTLLFVLQHFGRDTPLVLPLLMVGMLFRAGAALLGLLWMRWVWEAPLEPVAVVMTVFYLAGLACETWLLMPPVVVRTRSATRPEEDAQRQVGGRS